MYRLFHYPNCHEAWNNDKINDQLCLTYVNQAVSNKTLILSAFYTVMIIMMKSQKKKILLKLLYPNNGMVQREQLSLLSLNNIINLLILIIIMKRVIYHQDMSMLNRSEERRVGKESDFQGLSDR